MIWLVAASLLWAFSFGLIKNYLTSLDPWLVAAIRLTLAAVVFLPWTVGRAPARALRPRALGLGAVQFGAMYVCYVASFRHLLAWQVALWTVFTPIMVALFAHVRRRRGSVRALGGALLAVAGALLAEGRWPQDEALHGILLVQGSNLCFALGQLGYRSLARRAGVAPRGGGPREVGLLGWMYLGGAGVALVGLAWSRPVPLDIADQAVPVLVYLGVVPTALGFWLWNKGAARASSGRLAAANNLKVPLAVLMAWSVFGETAPYLRAAAGLGFIIAAFAIVGREPSQGDPGPEGPGSRSTAGSWRQSERANRHP